MAWRANSRVESMIGPTSSCSPQDPCMTSIYRHPALCRWLLTLAAPVISIVPLAAQVVRPSIWTTASERPAVLAKIREQPWAQAQFETLRERCADAVAQHRRDPVRYLRQLPWKDAAAGAHPSLPRIDRNPAEADEGRSLGAIQSMLGEAVDCAVIYHLTGETDHARLAADVLQAFVRAWREIPFSDDLGNGGWLIRNDHLFEARATVQNHESRPLQSFISFSSFVSERPGGLTAATGHPPGVARARRRWDV